MLEILKNNFFYNKNMKKEYLIYDLIIFLLVVFGLFVSYIGYIKPEREYLKLKAEYCTQEAFGALNDLIDSQYSSNTYKTKKGVENMIVERNNKLIECYDYYDSFLFSNSEENIYIFNINKLFDEQEKKIEKYLNWVEQIEKENQANINRKNNCQKMREEYNKYIDCVNKIDFLLGSSNNEKECLSKYNYKRFGVDESDCIFIDIFN